MEKRLSIGVILALAVLGFDLNQPLGVAAGVPYILPVLVCLSAKKPSCIYWMASLGSVLTVVGYFFSPDGGIHWVVLINRGLAIFAIWAVAIFGAKRLQEIGMRKTAEDNLLRQKAQSDQFLNVAANMMVALDERGCITLLNRAGGILLECDEKKTLGLDWFENFIPADQRDLVRIEYQKVMNGETEPFGENESNIVTANGDRKLVRWLNAIIQDDDGNIVGTLSSGEDITEHKKAAADLAEINAQFQSAFEGAMHGMALVELNGKLMRVNKAFCSMTGYTEDELCSGGFQQITHPADLQDDLNLAQEKGFLNGEKTSLRWEKRYIHKDGHEIPARLGITLVRDEDGQPLHFISQIEDLTAIKESENQLRQAQKMEAVGQLTGGVAHDFNNLLAIIEGNLSLLGDDLDEGLNLKTEELWEFILPALQASKRGAELTHRLLAFSRRQALRPVALDINSVVEDMEGLLRRTLREDIDLAFRLECTGWLAEADASELQNVVLNMALNAQDAMSEGGSLTIETGEVTLDDAYAASHVDVTAGDYVMLAVTDTGIGMDGETLERVFEPFFTTKDVGKGTGLGLSMVYGFVKQSGGHVAIYSEPGEGTTVKLYLPRTTVTEAAASAKDHKILAAGGHETILIIEDDEDVRRMTRRILTRLGYRVFEAGDGQAALTILEDDNRVDLLLTDVVLPGGMSGPDVVRAVQEEAPGLKVLYMSGYTENAILHHGRLDQGVNLIGKPFSHIDLGVKVRDVLDTVS